MSSVERIISIGNFPQHIVNCASPAVFLSDCHLPLIPRKGQEVWASKVIRFFNEIAIDARTLFLMGDLFDFWFEWRYSVPANVFQVLFALHNLVNKGVDVYFIAGNHDGHPGAFLERQVGLKVIRGNLDVRIDEKLLHLSHGDGVAKFDRGYRLLRTIVRWKFTENAYRLIHPDLGIWFANRLSKFSRTKFSLPDKFGAQPYRDYAMPFLNDGFNYVVLGHRHSAEFIPHTNGGYLAIGEWIESGSYGIFKDGELKLAWFP